MRRALSWTVSVITWLLVLSSMIVIGGSLLGRPLLLAAVLTGSMVPVLNPGDLILVLPAMSPPVRGDIIVFRTKAHPSWIVHRVIEGDQWQGFTTKGDANAEPDPDVVMPNEVAGFVPVIGGKPLHMPHVGLLSGERTPLSDSTVAVVTLLVGVFFVASDLKLPQRVSANVRKRRGKKSEATGVYVTIAFAALLVTLLPTLALWRSGLIDYQVIEKRTSSFTAKNLAEVGEDLVTVGTVTNPSPVPVVKVVTSADPAVTFEPSWLFIPPHGKVEVNTHIRGDHEGRFVARTHEGVYLPLLPPATLAWLDMRSPWLAAILDSLFPVFLVFALAATDGQFRRNVHLVWLRFRMRTSA
jgi:signal peptidase